MNIYETIGLAWVIFTSSAASIAFFFLAYRGLKQHFFKSQPQPLTPEAK